MDTGRAPSKAMQCSAIARIHSHVWICYLAQVYAFQILTSSEESAETMVAPLLSQVPTLVAVPAPYVSMTLSISGPYVQLCSMESGYRLTGRAQQSSTCLCLMNSRLSDRVSVWHTSGACSCRMVFLKRLECDRFLPRVKSSTQSHESVSALIC